MNNILHSEYSKKFTDLWEGKWQSLYPSNSEADLGFVRILSNNHAPIHQIDRLYRKTKLYRPKWDEKRGIKTYGELTLIQGTTEP
jgi:putative DNA primase/helicase